MAQPASGPRSILEREMSEYCAEVQEAVAALFAETGSCDPEELILLGVRLGLEAAAKLDVTGFGMVRVDALLALDPAAVLRKEPRQNDNG